jgi:hypothetical protein
MWIHIITHTYISGYLGTWYKSTTTIRKRCWWDYLSYSMFKYTEQCCGSIYYSNFFLFPSFRSCSCWKPRFEHISFLFPLIWHITLIVLSCPKVYRQIRLDAKIKSMIDIWGGHVPQPYVWNSGRWTLTLPKWGLGSQSGLPKLQSLILGVKHLALTRSIYHWKTIKS